MGDRSPTGDPLVGWIKAAGEGFANERDARSLAGFTGVDLDPRRLAYFRAYRQAYFHDRFHPGQGTEEILADLERHGRGGRWLDLGAGTTTLFWSIPLAGIAAISCCDLVVEALAALDEFARSGEVPPCYAEVLAMFGKPPEHLTAMRRRIERYLVFDTLAPWPSWLADERFDLITAFGNFGIAPDREGYAGCWRRLARQLAPGGRALGADWVRTGAFIAEDGHDNSYLAAPQVAAAIVAAGLSPLGSREVLIAGDPCYRAVICWAAERPGDAA